MHSWKKLDSLCAADMPEHSQLRIAVCFHFPLCEEASREKEASEAAVCEQAELL